ncbi:hypothetical protein acdb102_07590 [Acidothermaceae bacterium B102]|nr:hypothetical protein acdb102_07590 [Acidothermaceae bacterium B102]
MGRVGLRWVTATSVALSLMVAAAPAQAAAAKTSHLREAAAPATVLIGTRVVVSGAVSPSVKGKPVYLQRVVAGKWKTVGHVASGKLGVYSFSVKATGKAGTWSLRVMRPASSAAKAVVGKTLKVRLTKTAYKITAVTVSKVNAGNPIAVAGVVTPKTTGQVVLQRLIGGKWTTLATARLASSAYSISKVFPAGAYTLRVTKPYNATIATGNSRVLHVTVFPAPGTTPRPTVSPKLSLTSPDDAVLALPGHRLVYSTIHSAATPPQSLTYTNTGNAPVTISGLAIEGVDAASFSLVAGQPTTITIPAGGTATVGVQFNPTPTTGCPVALPANNPHQYDIGNAVRLAGLVFSSTDVGLPGGAVDLGGINSCSLSGDNEPVLDQVLQALGYTDVVDQPNHRRFLGQAAHIPGTDEITASYFKSANPALPVSLTPLTHYSTPSTVPYHTAGWYAQGSTFAADPACTAACNKLWDFPADPSTSAFNQNQKLLPVPEGTTTFSPTTNFGLYLGEFSDVNFTDDHLNLAHDSHNAPLLPSTYLHDIRVYPAYDVNHVAIPNTYLLAVDVTRVPDFKNNDFQDVVMILRNATPVS